MRRPGGRTGTGRGSGARRAVAALPLALALLALPGGGAVADEGAAGPGAAGDAAPPAPVDLDALFKLPDDADPLRPPSAGGLTRERWEARFAEAHDAVRAAESALADAQRQIEDLASDSQNWQMAAPGAKPTAENSPLSYKLRQEIRRRREEVDRAKRQLQELNTEASLAGVPEAWRRPPQHQDAIPGAPGG